MRRFRRKGPPRVQGQKTCGRLEAPAWYGTPAAFCSYEDCKRVAKGEEPEKYFYPESEEEEEDDDQRLKLKEITQIVSVRDVDVETLGPVQQRNPIETDDLEYAVRGTYKDKEDTTGFEMKTSFCTLESMLVDLGADVVTEALRKYERAQAVKRQRLIDTWAQAQCAQEEAASST